MGKKKISTGVWLLGLLDCVFVTYTGSCRSKKQVKNKNRDKVGSVGRSFLFYCNDGTYYDLRNACGRRY